MAITTKGVLDWILYKKVKNYITEIRNNYVYVLPYYHFQNPIEKFFYQLKYYMRKDEHMSYDLIKESIKSSIKNIKVINHH